MALVDTAASAARPPFSWSGGDPSVDFANTVSWGSLELSEERLREYRDLVDWAAEGGLVASAANLRRLAARDGDGARSVLAKALELRRALHDLFAARARGGRPPAGALAVLERWTMEAAARRRLVPHAQSLRWEWTDESDLAAPLRRMARAAALLLTGEDAARLKLCGNPECGWAFVDRSRRGNRRWCEMAACGSRDKARRYYHRRRRAAGAVPGRDSRR